MNQDQCTRTGCFADRQSGDELFCYICRKQWRAFCERVPVIKVGLETFPLNIVMDIPDKQLMETRDSIMVKALKAFGSMTQLKAV